MAKVSIIFSKCTIAKFSSVLPGVLASMIAAGPALADVVKLPTTTDTKLTTTATTRVLTPVQKINRNLDHTVNRFFNRGTLTPGSFSAKTSLTGLSDRSDDDKSLDHLVLVGDPDDGKSDDDRDRLGSVASQGHLTSSRDDAADGKDDSSKDDDSAGDKDSAKKDKRDGDSVDSSANQGIGDGPNVNVSAGNASDLSAAANTKTIRLGQGTAFALYKQPLRIRTQHGDINIAPNAAVYVMQIGKSVAVYNIADGKLGDVHISMHDASHLSVKPGEQILLTEKSGSDFAHANPGSDIPSSSVKELTGHPDIKVFNAQFSPVDALDRLPEFQKLTRSSKQSDRLLANKILKTAAIIMTLRGN